MKLTLLFAVLTMLASVGIMWQERIISKKGLIKEESEIKKGFILKMEFAKDNDTVEKIFRSFKAPVSAAVKYLKYSVKIDFAFLVFYPLFLFFFAKYLGGFSDWKLWIVGGLCLLMALSDGGENLQLLKILNRHMESDFSAFFPALSLFTWLKWGAISVVLLLLGFAFFENGNWALIILGAIFILSFVAGILAIFGIIKPEPYAQSAMLGFTLLMVLTISENTFTRLLH